MVNPTAAREISFEQAKKTIYHFITNACYIKLWEKSYLLVLVKKSRYYEGCSIFIPFTSDQKSLQNAKYSFNKQYKKQKKKDNAKFKKYMQSKQISER